jgi:hypothetical protein
MGSSLPAGKAGLKFFNGQVGNRVNIDTVPLKGNGKVELSRCSAFSYLSIEILDKSGRKFLDLCTITAIHGALSGF